MQCKIYTQELLSSPKPFQFKGRLKSLGAFVSVRGDPSQAEAAIRRSGHN